MTTWAAWRSLHPQTTVWSDPRLPGRRRFTQESLSRITLAGEGPIVNQDLVVGVEGPKSARAYLLRQLAAAGRVANDSVDGAPIVVALAEDAVTVLVWQPRRERDAVLTFAASGALLRDLQTGSSWDVQTGRALQRAARGPHARGRRSHLRAVVRLAQPAARHDALDPVSASRRAPQRCSTSTTAPRAPSVTRSRPASTR